MHNSSFSTADNLAYLSWRRTGVINNINDNCIPFRGDSSRILAHWDTQAVFKTANPSLFQKILASPNCIQIDFRKSGQQQNT